MGNPGVYDSPTEGWAFVPFLGTVLAFAITVVAVLYWIAGPSLKVKATLLTTIAIVVGGASVLGLSAAATSFEERDALAFATHSAKVLEWAEHEYDLTLTKDDVADLVRGRPVAVEFARGTISVHLRPIPGGDGVYLVGPDEAPIP
ncbi:MAG: hypothetical protein ACOH14_03360 [Rhodoglobus sp.]